jgi:hypothetical protein
MRVVLTDPSGRECQLSVKRKTEASSGENWRQRENAEASEADQARKADLPAADAVVPERDEWRCQKCRLLENLQVHHKIKRSQLGNDSLDNLVGCVCRPFSPVFLGSIQISLACM